MGIEDGGKSSPLSSSGPRRGLGRGLGAILPARLHDHTDRATAEANRDPLTGLFDRPVLTIELDQVLAEAATRGDAVGVLVFGLSGFRHVNAGYGHDVGDEVLAQLGRRLAGTGRSADVVARLGGDEFAVVFPRVDPEAHPDRLAARLQSAIGQPIVVDGVSHCLNAVTGVVVWRPTDDDLPNAGLARDLLRRADLAMQRSRDLHRSALDAGLDTETAPAAGADFGSETREIGLDGEFLYAPVLDLRRASVSGLLARPRVGPGGADGPEATWAPQRFEQLMFDVSGWMSDHPLRDSVRVWSIVDAKDLLDPEFVDRFELVPPRYGVPHHLTGVVVSGPSTSAPVAAALRHLAELGVAVAVDPTDASVGDLWALLDEPVVGLWLGGAASGSGAADTDDGRAMAVTRGLVALARDVGLSAVAAGVRDNAHARQLRAMGFTHGWGAAFGEDLAAHDAGRLLRSSG